MNIQEYMQDGAGYQARAVLMALQGKIGDGIEDSWDNIYKCYRADIRIGRWENCREQGYVISLSNGDMKQLNVIWYEHRNSDSICAVKWLQNTLNTPTISTAEFGEVFKDKYDVSISLGHGEYQDMADWIYDEIETHWNNKGE